MAGPLLRSEPLQRYRALGLSGDPVWRAAGQLRTAIAQRLSREHADLLAIPEVDPSGRRIDWYAPFDGEVRRLADLGESERNSVASIRFGKPGDATLLRERLRTASVLSVTPVRFFSSEPVKETGVRLIRNSNRLNATMNAVASHGPT